VKLEIVHRTRYRYATPVRDSFNELRLRPVSNGAQDCESFLLRVLPPVRLRHYQDLHGNHVSFFDLGEPHRSLEIEARSRVRTSSGERAAEPPAFPLSRAKECARLESCHEFLQESRYVDLAPESWRLALDATAAADDLWRAALALMRVVHGELAYQPGSTTVHTRAGEALRARRGVCQDFAHVMIALCRAIGIPALYVSGYLYNGPREQLRGAQASHAWCEVYVPGGGWRGLDPTNDQPAGDHHVKLAVGRDYADVAPVQGRYRGTAEQELEVEVGVERLEG
jgi:transglutaminase-like putative cysteine protease